MPSLYTGANGLKIQKVSHFASIYEFPQVTTTANNAVIDTITDLAYRPVVDIDIATKVYNGSSYVDCWLQIKANGTVQILSSSGAVTAGYQSMYCKLKGFVYLSNA